MLLVRFFLFIVIEISGLRFRALFAAFCDDMVRRAQVPRDELTIDATTDDNLWVFRREFDSRDLDRGL